MKYILSLLIALLLMTGCHRPATGELCTELQRAEALMYPYPDSALHILQTMDMPGDELNRATWALFTTQAKYKLYQTQSDSLINIALPYFLENGDTQRKALTLYYRAALYKEHKDIEKAQEFYYQAIKEVEKTEDYVLGHLIYAGLGGLYLYRDLIDYAKEVYNKAYDYAQMANNKKAIIASCMYLGRIEKELHNYNKAIVYYNEAITLSKEINASEMLVSALNDLALGYMYSKDFQNALHYIKESIKIAEKDSLEINESRYTTIGQIYLKLNQLDSAEFYIKKALTSSNVYRLENAYITLHNIYNKKNLYKEASSSLAKAWIYNDSITKLDKSRTLIEMQEKYDQQKVKDEAAMEIRLQKQRTQTTIGIIIVVVLLAGIYARHRYRQRIARLAEAEERIDTLSRMLEEAQQATDEDDAFVKRMLLQQLGVIRLVAGTPTAQNQALLRRLSELGNDQVPVEELIVWEDLYPIIDRLYNGFHAHLTERFGSVLTDKEVQICCLLCAGFSTKEISVITHQSTSSIYVRKTSIRKKLGIEEGADIVEAVKK